ncbi:MAG: hypothetical protein ACUVWK_06710 [Nitrososphaerales archaeon]
MKVGRGALWRGKRAEGLPLITCEAHLRDMVDGLNSDRTLISAMIEPLEDVDEGTVRRKRLSPEPDRCQIFGCKELAVCKLTVFRSVRLGEWHKLKPPS